MGHNNSLHYRTFIEIQQHHCLLNDADERPCHDSSSRAVAHFNHLNGIMIYANIAGSVINILILILIITANSAADG